MTSGPQLYRDISLRKLGYIGRPQLTTQAVEEAFLKKCQEVLDVDLFMSIPEPRQRRWTTSDYLTCFKQKNPNVSGREVEVLRDLLNARGACIDYVEARGWQHKAQPERLMRRRFYP